MSDRVTIYRRPDSSSGQARWWDAHQSKMICRSLRTPDRNVAKRRAADLDADLLEGKSDRIPTKAAADRYLAHQKRRIGKQKHEIVTRHLARAVDVLPKILADVRPKHVSRWLTRLSGATSTRNDHRRSLHGLFAWAEREELRAGNPVRAVRPLREPTRLIHLPD